MIPVGPRSDEPGRSIPRENDQVQRYCDVPLPARRYVPGRGPHPRQRAEPHLPRLPERPSDAPPLEAGGWRESIAYRYAIDLFNHAYFWEAHEVFEGLAHETGPASTTGRFLAGLIQLSAAMLKDSPASHAGAQRLMARALPALRPEAAVFLGIDVSTLAHQVQALASGERTDPPRIRLELGAPADGGPLEH